MLLLLLCDPIAELDKKWENVDKATSQDSNIVALPFVSQPADLIG